MGVFEIKFKGNYILTNLEVKKFEYVKRGEVFLYDGSIFMKTDEVCFPGDLGLPISAVDIETGRMDCIGAQKEVKVLIEL